MSEPSKALALLNELEDLGIATRTGLILTDQNMSYERVEALAAYLGEVSRRCAWYIGDLLVYSEKLFGESYAQISAVTGLSPSTISNRVAVCSRIPPHRRKPGMNLSVHAEAAYLEPQVRDEWLQRARDNDWSREEMREHLRAAGLKNPKKTKAIEPGPEIIYVDDEAGWQEIKMTYTCPSCGHEWHS